MKTSLKVGWSCYEFMYSFQLKNLYDGKFLLLNETNNYINLSNHQLSNDERKFLNLGLNFHIQPKYEKIKKEDRT